MEESRSEFKDDVSATIYTNTQKLIKGNTVRDKFLDIADSVLFIEDDGNTPGGFLAIDETTDNVDVSFIKAVSPSGKFLKDDGTWSTVSASGALFPKVAQVYLVNNTTDQADMGGTARNVFTTAQAAWDQAKAMVAAGAGKVEICVGVTDASTVGNVAMGSGSGGSGTAICWVGLGSALSAIGNITGSTAADPMIQLKGITAGTLTNVTGGSNGALVLEESVIGNLTLYGGSQQWVLGSGVPHKPCRNSVIGDILVSGIGTNQCSLSVIDAQGIFIGNITTVLNGQVTISNIQSTYGAVSMVKIQSITMNNVATRGTSLILNNTEVTGNIVFNSSVAFTKAVVLKNTRVLGTTSINISGGTNTFDVTNSIFENTIDLTGSSLSGSPTFRGVTAGKVTAMPANTLLLNSSFFDTGTSTPVINGIGSGCQFHDCSIVGGSRSIDNTSAVSVKLNKTSLGISAGSNIGILTDDRLRRVQTVTPSTGGVASFNSDVADVIQITGLSLNISSFSDGGTPRDTQLIEIQITDNGTARTITTGSSFASTTVNFPTTTVASKKLSIFLEYWSSNSKWNCVGTC